MPVVVGGYLAVSKVLGAKKEEAPEVANFRASLAGMSDLEELSAMERSLAIRKVQARLRQCCRLPT